MLKRAKIFGVISVLALSLAACSDNSGNANNPNQPEDKSGGVAATSASPVVDKTSSTSGSIAVPGVKNISEIKFKAPPTNNPLGAGVFDVVNKSSNPNHKISKSQPITLSGWAILLNKGKPANNVIITLGDNKTVLAVTPVNANREDVAKALKNPALKNSGWNTQITASALPTGKVVLKAWAYDAGTKEAVQLRRDHNLEVTE